MTNKKYISELNREELSKVYHANTKLREDIQEDMFDTEMMYIDDTLMHFKDSLNDYSISSYAHCYIAVDDNKRTEFADGIKRVNEDFGYLELSKDLIIDLESNMNKLNEDDNLTDEEYDELEKEVNDSIELLARELSNAFQNQLIGTYEEDNQISYFVEFYGYERLENDVYIITGENNYTLYEDKTIAYN